MTLKIHQSVEKLITLYKKCTIFDTLFQFDTPMDYLVRITIIFTVYKNYTKVILILSYDK